MLKSRPPLPTRVRFLNAVGRFLQAVNPPLTRFDEETVCKAAMKQTGLADFGDPHYREGLLRVLESAEDDANLHFIGRLATRDVIISGLANRLLLTEARKRTPDVFQRPLVPPIIILGLPRSGTTLLHRLLAADPMHRAVPLWELLRPLPTGSSVNGSPDRRRQLVEQRLNSRLKLAPDLDRKHYVRADTPEECMWLLAATFVSVVFWVVAPVYGYLDWYSRQDSVKAYQEYYWLLQVLQAVDPTRRLTLKAPAHTGALAALLQTIPNALLIQTHRNPVTVCNSLNSLFYSLHGSVTERLDLPRMAEANIRLLENDIALNLATRDTYPNTVFDVYYEQLVADPVGTVKGVYDHFGLAWSDVYEQRLHAHVRENPREKYGRHRYASDNFGQTDAAIAKRFVIYSERFGFKNTGD